MPLKDFAILTKLGEGAYSSVYKVKRVIDDEIYALKKVKLNNLSEKEQENALNEVRILASIKNRNIVAYKEAFIESSSLCIIMEFSDDGDLYQKIVQLQKSKQKFDEQTIWRTLINITIGLKKLHDFNILHRDLKSANVFLSRNGDAKLGDMNVSKIAKNGLLYTQTGTPYYASPEVWKDKPYDSKSDIWSLGCVIYEMTALKPPFRAEDMDGLYKKVTKGLYTRIGDEYSAALSSVVHSLLQVNPSQRPNATQLLYSLAAKAQELNIELDEEQQEQNQLLKTIKPHRKFHYLTDRLPQSNYKKIKGVEGEDLRKITHTTGKPTKQGAVFPNLKSVNLPKMDNILLKNSGIKKEAEKNREKESPALRVDGQGNYKRSEVFKMNEKIKADIRKIYNIREPPKKINHRMLELPRIK